MALKRRGRKPSKKTQQRRSDVQKKAHWLDCIECGVNGSDVEGDVTKFTCGNCVQKAAAPPDLKAPLTDEQKAQKKAKKVAKAEKARALAAGEVVETPKFSFGRGWHRKIVFSAEVNGKTRYFSLGKEIKKAEFTKLKKAQKKTKKAAPKKWGRGWHLKVRFVAPNGDVYKRGKLQKKAS